MSELPASWEEVTIRHKFVYYTFFLFIGLVILTLASSVPLWYVGPLSFRQGILLQWATLMFACGYMSLFGEYVMPAETYRNYRSGKWDNS